MLILHKNLKDVRKDARDLLNALRRCDVMAVRRYQALDPIAGMLAPRLEEAQYVIAREYGYSSWRKLKEHLGTDKNSEADKNSGTSALGRLYRPMD